MLYNNGYVPEGQNTWILLSPSWPSCPQPTLEINKNASTPSAFEGPTAFKAY